MLPKVFTFGKFRLLPVTEAATTNTETSGLRISETHQKTPSPFFVWVFSWPFSAWIGLAAGFDHSLTVGFDSQLTLYRPPERRKESGVESPCEALG